MPGLLLVLSICSKTDWNWSRILETGEVLETYFTTFHWSHIIRHFELFEKTKVKEWKEITLDSLDTLFVLFPKVYGWTFWSCVDLVNLHSLHTICPYPIQNNTKHTYTYIIVKSVAMDYEQMMTLWKFTSKL